MRRQLLPAMRMLLVMTVLTGLVYPLIVTGIAQGVFPGQASGSLVTVGEQVVGSRLIGQQIEGDEWFHPRPSAVEHESSSSGGSNLGPTNPDFIAIVAQRVAAYRDLNRLDPTVSVPVDAVTASGSGLDPHISLANARLQASRVAAARRIGLDTVMGLIDEKARPPQAGILTEATVNVLELNLALREEAP